MSACFLWSDIGAYNTCGHLCKYCYANYSAELVNENMRKHDVNSPLLIGNLREGDVIHSVKQCIDFDGEPAYCNIQGEWRTEGVYAVVHRISISSQFRNRGLAKEIFELIETLCNDKGIKSIRIDTYRLNERMQHVLTKSGFIYCGIVTYPFGERLAYERILG